MSKDKKAFLSAVAAAMQRYGIRNSVVIYILEDQFHNTALSLDQEHTEGQRKMNALSDQLNEYFKQGENEQN